MILTKDFPFTSSSCGEFLSVGRPQVSRVKARHATAQFNGYDLQLTAVELNCARHRNLRHAVAEERK